jgi:hypothetical protein
MKKIRAKPNTAPTIPPPPGLDEGYDAIIAYHKKYSMEELNEAGYLEDVPAEHQREVQAAATYQLLCLRGLQLKLSRRDYEILANLAAREDLQVEVLVKRWIKQRMREASDASSNGEL